MNFLCPDPEIIFNLLKERGKVEKKWKIMVNQFHFFHFLKGMRICFLFFKFIQENNENRSLETTIYSYDLLIFYFYEV
jgi:hypothetical protein